MGPCVLTVFLSLWPHSPVAPVLPGHQDPKRKPFCRPGSARGRRESVISERRLEDWRRKNSALPGSFHHPQPRRPSPSNLTAATGNGSNLASPSREEDQKVAPCSATLPLVPRTCRLRCETITWCAALVSTPAFACSQVHIVHRVPADLICPFPVIIARAHAPPSLSTASLLDRVA